MTMMIVDTPTDGSPRDLCSRLETGVLESVGAAHETVAWQLPEETPVAIQINSQAFTVMMATPADLRDFAVGIVLAEGVVRDPNAIQGVLAMPVDGGFAVDIAILESALDASRIGRRSIEGRSGCGLCGVEDIASVIRPLTPVKEKAPLVVEAVVRAARDFASHQPMNHVNRSVHGAAFVSRDGVISLVREDVGRHNALDKLIGALVLSKADMTDGFVLMTSRCSFELVQKCVTAGITALVTVSAPTTLALDLARANNLSLGALQRDSVVVFNP
jgi:FdhD protein